MKRERGWWMVFSFLLEKREGGRDMGKMENGGVAVRLGNSTSAVVVVILFCCSSSLREGA
jgi:hypothetical protein